ncbi:MAG: hypothetical protein CVV02_11490 [Firmicutes bacterium HGW-Firmicutes-7]|nr:MAG: hypothetical protein CVV02_11490 [Firmicutes bacterium HGW-Firmicutes-7]
MKAKYYILSSIFVVLSIIIIAFTNEKEVSLEFERELWVNDISIRLSMIESLLESYYFEGMSRHEIENILGNPSKKLPSNMAVTTDLAGKEKEPVDLDDSNYYVYFITEFERPEDAMAIYFNFDSEDKVEEYHIIRFQT